MSLLKKNKVNCVDTNAYEQKYLKEVTVPLKHAAYISKRNIDIVSTLCVLRTNAVLRSAGILTPC